MSCDICKGKGTEPIFEENGYNLVRCDHCGHFFVAPVPTEIISGFALDEQPPPTIHKENELLRLPIFDEYVREVKKYVSGGHWLDLGCGCGTLLATAKTHGFDAVGIDIDTKRLNLCQAAGLTVSGEELTADSFGPSSFDVVSLTNVFSHLTSPSATFEMIVRILKPGGVILVATSECSKTAYKNEVDRWHIPDHLHFAGPKTLQRLAARFGLNLFYVKRELSQKAILSEKLAYDSEKVLLQALKLMFRYVSWLTGLASLIICLKRGYYHPRREVVAIFQKPYHRKTALEAIPG